MIWLRALIADWLWATSATICADFSTGPGQIYYESREAAAKRGSAALLVPVVAGEIVGQIRQQMQRSAYIAVKNPALAVRVDLNVDVFKTTVQAQINSLNSFIRNKPDAILIDVGSIGALNPTIQKACDTGIVVVAFDQIVSAPCAFKMESDWGRAPG
jgi:ABC-type sugar transport system substrate-binding protein